jgi:hypothetical protein
VEVGQETAPAVVLVVLVPCRHLQGWQLATEQQQAVVAGRVLAVVAMVRLPGVLRVVRAAAAGTAPGVLLLALRQTSQRCPNR